MRSGVAEVTYLTGRDGMSQDEYCPAFQDCSALIVSIQYDPANEGTAIP